jgi:hypothetical protein
VLIRKLLLAAVAVVAIVYLTRGTVARYAPGLPAFYSMKSEIFTYENTYTSGRVGPFVIGQSRAGTLATIEAGRATDLVEVQISPTPFTTDFKPSSSLTEADRRYLAAAHQWRFASSSLGVPVVYRLTFDGDQLAAIKLTSSLVSSL